MVWYFIGVYIIHRAFHGRLEIRNFSSSVEKYFKSERMRSDRLKYFFQLLVMKKIFQTFAALTLEIFFNTRREFRISAQSCNIVYKSIFT